jgi:hypothetical protein
MLATKHKYLEDYMSWEHVLVNYFIYNTKYIDIIGNLFVGGEHEKVHRD